MVQQAVKRASSLTLGVGRKSSSSSAGSAAGPKWSRGVLVLVASDEDAAEEVSRALQLAVNHHVHHAKDGAKSKAAAELRLAKTSGGLGGLMQAFHHIYRPHHHANHPPPRFHLGIEAEVLLATPTRQGREHRGSRVWHSPQKSGAAPARHALFGRGTYAMLFF